MLRHTPRASRHHLPRYPMPTIPKVAARIPRRMLGLRSPALLDGPSDRAHRSGRTLGHAQSEHLPASDTGLTFELRRLPCFAFVEGDLHRLDRRIAGERDPRDLLRAGRLTTA